MWRVFGGSTFDLKVQPPAAKPAIKAKPRVEPRMEPSLVPTPPDLVEEVFKKVRAENNISSPPIAVGN